MCYVIHSVKKRYFLLVAFHLHILSINHERTTESFPVAVPLCHIIIVRKLLHLLYDSCVCPIQTSVDALGKCPNTQSFQVKT